MKVHFWPSSKPRTLHSRRGLKAHRIMVIPPGTSVVEYMPLSLSVVELIEDGEVTGVYDTPTNNPRKAIMKDIRDERSQNQDGSNVSDGSKTEDNDSVQQVGKELHPNGETVSGTDELQVPSVVEGDARLEQSEERGSESSPDGLHSDNDEPSVLHNRSVEGVSSVPASIEDAGRN